MPRSETTSQEPREAAGPGCGRPRDNLFAHLAAAAAVCIAAWLLPDALGPSQRSPFQLVASATGARLVGLLAEPAAGAILALALALRSRPRAIAGLAGGAIAAFAPLAAGPAPFPIAGHWIAALACAALAAAAALRPKGHPRAAHAAIAAVPVALLAFAAGAAATGAHPSAHLAPFWAPAVLYAGLLTASSSAAALVDRERSPRPG